MTLLGKKQESQSGNNRQYWNLHLGKISIGVKCETESKQ
jgi:hypothetical protein